jgi:hypothetical protein
MRKNQSGAQTPTMKQLTVMASVVVAAYLAFVGVVGRVFKNEVTPLVIDDWFGVTDHVMKVISSKMVEAGYSAAFTFGPNDRLPRSLLFSSMDGERPTLTLRMYALQAGALTAGAAAGDPQIDVRVDGQVVHLDGAYPIKLTKLSIDQKLDHEVEDNTHEISFSPRSIPPGTEVTVQCLVMVYRK